MNCTDFQSNLYDFREGKLSKPMHRAYADHLLTCRTCTQLMTASENLERLIESEKETMPGPFVATRILQRIEAEFGPQGKQVSPAWIRLLQPVTLAVALLCGILIGSYTAKRDNPQTAAYGGQDGNIESLRANLFIPEMTEEDKIVNLNN